MEDPERVTAVAYYVYGRECRAGAKRQTFGMFWARADAVKIRDEQEAKGLSMYIAVYNLVNLNGKWCRYFLTEMKPI